MCKECTRTVEFTTVQNQRTVLISQPCLEIKNGFGTQFNESITEAVPFKYLTEEIFLLLVRSVEPQSFNHVIVILWYLS